MRYPKLFLLVAFLLWSSSVLAQPKLVVSDSTEYFKFTIEFTDSSFLETYAESTELVKGRAEIALLLVYSELMCPAEWLNRFDATNLQPVYHKIRALEKMIERWGATSPQNQKRIKARNALARIYKKLYDHYQYDWIVEKWRPKKK